MRGLFTGGKLSSIVPSRSNIACSNPIVAVSCCGPSAGGGGGGGGGAAATLLLIDIDQKEKNDRITNK